MEKHIAIFEYKNAILILDGNNLERIYNSSENFVVIDYNINNNSLRTIFRTESQNEAIQLACEFGEIWKQSLQNNNQTIVN